MGKGAAFELEVFEAVKHALLTGALSLLPHSCKVFHNKRYLSKDRRNGVVTDVSIEAFQTGAAQPWLIWIWECKDYSHNVSVDDIQEFHAKLEEIGPDKTKGTVITRLGFQTGAIEYATSNGLGLVRLMRVGGDKPFIKTVRFFDGKDVEQVLAQPGQFEALLSDDTMVSPVTRFAIVDNLVFCGITPSGTRISSRDDLDRYIVREFVGSSLIPDAIRHALLATDIATRRFGSEDVHTLNAMSNLADGLAARGHFADALQLHDKVVEISLCTLGEKHPSTITFTASWALALAEAGNLSAAEPLHRRAVQDAKEVFGSDHEKTLVLRNNLGGTLWKQGRKAEAMRIAEEVMCACRRVFGPEHDQTAGAALNLWTLLRASGDLHSAKALVESDLSWLLKRDANSLSPRQKEILELLMQESSQDHGPWWKRIFG